MASWSPPDLLLLAKLRQLTQKRIKPVDHLIHQMYLDALA
jgi:hypothetical protein